MLFTRCPECETTFRVTDETLKKAHGQVRCGRCASVFNGYAELRDPSAKSLEQAAIAGATASPPTTSASPTTTSASPTTETEAAQPPPAAATPQPIAPAPTPAPAPVATAAAVPAPAVPAAVDPVAASLGVRSLADVVAQVEQATAAAAEASEPRAQHSEATSVAEPDGPISPKEVDAVLATPIVVSTPGGIWPPFAVGPEPPRRSPWWNAAAVIALLALGVQLVHHYRADVAGDPTFGPWVQQTYAWVGAEVQPHWDVHQYEILDWVATAEPNARGLGSLKITAHIQNRGPLHQPFPAIRLKLKDRWEEAVASRLFTPGEYLPSATPRDRLMSPGETARAEIEIVDPGPDADGFELDVCIDVEASALSCGNDEVFLRASG